MLLNGRREGLRHIFSRQRNCGGSRKRSTTLAKQARRASVEVKTSAEDPSLGDQVKLYISSHGVAAESPEGLRKNHSRTR